MPAATRAERIAANCCGRGPRDQTLCPTHEPHGRLRFGEPDAARFAAVHRRRSPRCQFAATAVGYALVMSSSNFVPFWPQAGLALALTARVRAPRCQPLIIAGCMLGEIGGDLRFGPPDVVVWRELSYAGVCALEVSRAPCGCSRSSIRRELLVRMRNVIAFVLLLAGVSLAGAVLATFVTRVSSGSAAASAICSSWWVGGYTRHAALHAARA